MYAAQLTFRVPDGVELETVSSLIWSLTAAWLQNGQIYGCDTPLVRVDRTFHRQVMLPEFGALDSSHANTYVKQAVERLLAAGIPEPELTIIGEDEDASTRPCACIEQKTFILYTTFLDIESPLRCGACRRPVPLYRIPPVDGSGFYSLLSWQSDYHACDRLQIGCETLERAALREMGQVDSSLSKRGRSLCDLITENTGVPTYYFLYRWYGRSLKQERARKCPSCGGAWLLDEPWHGIFDFRCDRCRLVSNISDQV